MTNTTYRQRRAAKVKAKAAQPNHMYSYCRVVGCSKPARAGTTDGLDTRLCRRHYDQHQRHGSPYRLSYPAKAINPYRQAALAWLLANPDEFWTENAVLGVGNLYRQGGPHIEAFRLRGLTPGDRAKAHWARLRIHEVDPRLPVAAWVAVEAIITDDTRHQATDEFRRVQAAKLVHRMASGTHKRWEQEREPQRSVTVVHPVGGGSEIRWEYAREPQRTDLALPARVVELHAYPRSRGRVLRHIGADLEGAVELLVQHHLADIQEIKAERDRRGVVADRPNVRGMVSRRRPEAGGVMT